MSSEVADLYVRLRAETAQFSRGMVAAAETGESFTRRMGGIGAMVSKLGKATTAVGLGVAVASVKMAGDFQQQTNILVTAAGEAQGNLGKVRDGIKRIATETGTSWQQLTEGMYQAEKAGFDLAHGGLKVLQAAAQGAREEGAPLNDVVNGMTTVMKNYKIPGDQAVRVMNAMKTAAGEAKTNFGLFSASLSTVLPVAYSAHIKFEDIAGSLATMTQRGETVQHAAQLAAGTISRLTAANGPARSTLNQLGLTTQQVTKDLSSKGLSGTLNEVVDAIGKKLGPSGLYAAGVFNAPPVSLRTPAVVLPVRLR